MTNDCISEQVLRASAERIVRLLSVRKETISSAESCTGGLIAKAITDVAGSSAIFSGACVTYTNAVKTALLGVDPQIIATHTEVSFACAEAMALGARRAIGTTYALSTTGYAGPTGGTKTDPVGTVYIALASPAGVRSERFSAPEGATRADVRIAAAIRALAILENELTE